MHIEPTPMSSTTNSCQNGSSEAVPSRLQLLSVSKTVLLQAVDLLDNYITSDDQLTINSRFLPGSTIGMPILSTRNNYLTDLSTFHQESTCVMLVITSFSLWSASHLHHPTSSLMTREVAVYRWKAVDLLHGKPLLKQYNTSKRLFRILKWVRL